MRTVIVSIILNIIGQVFILGSIAKSLLRNSLNTTTIVVGALILLLSILVLLFHRTEFKDIEGTLVSSKVTIIHKFFSTVTIIGFLQFIFYYFIYAKLIEGKQFSGADFAGLIIAVMCIGIIVIAFKFKQIKFDSNTMYISNYFTHQEVPLSDVVWVKTSLFPLAFRVKYTKGGKSIIDYFMTNTGSFALVVDEKIKNFKEAIEKNMKPSPL